MKVQDRAAVTPEIAAPAPAARRRRRRQRAASFEPLLWMAPAIAVVLFVFGYSLVDLVRSSLQDQGQWVGLENFTATFSDPLFRTALFHNLRLLVVAVPVLVLLSLLLSILLFETLRGWRFHRAVIFLPYILPIPVVAVIFGQILQLNGLLNQVLRAVGLGVLAIDWLGKPMWALWTMTGVIIWKELGFGVILLLARLLSMSAEPFEAARIDGPQGHHRVLRGGRGDHHGVVGLQLRVRDEQRPRRPRILHDGHRAVHLPDGVPVRGTAGGRRRCGHPVRRLPRAHHHLLSTPPSRGG
jgi:ABC-type glycerol-3-phosphate transport system permease component